MTLGGASEGFSSVAKRTCPLRYRSSAVDALGPVIATRKLPFFSKFPGNLAPVRYILFAACRVAVVGWMQTTVRYIVAFLFSCSYQHVVENIYAVDAAASLDDSSL